MLEIGERAPKLTFEDPDGKPVSLATSWENGPAIVVFLRHFG